MKILLSAYACEPDKGSEPGVGWNWALEIARLGHKVWVLTRANNQLSIKSEFLGLSEKNNLHFLYYDLPRWAYLWKKGNRGIYLYYFLWQLGAYFLAKKIHSKENFNLVHHITFGVIRQPSFMWMLRIPYILGPVGGGETAPWRLRFGYPLKGFITDILRDILNFLTKFDLFTLLNFRVANEIYVKTPDTMGMIPKKYQKKAKLLLEIGINSEDSIITHTYASYQPLRMIFVGRFIYWKGMHIGLLAFSVLSKLDPEARLTMVGEGPEENKWRNLVKRLGIEDKIYWTGWISHEKIKNLYSEHDVMLFPSLHDSSGNAVLEALSHSLPVICLQVGGPSIIVNSSCGYVIPVLNLNTTLVVDKLANSMIKLNYDYNLRNSLKKGAINRSKQFSWSSSVSKVYKNRKFDHKRRF
jgi:glycosyltransferase involved in cell wall biosynthesis